MQRFLVNQIVKQDLHRYNLEIVVHILLDLYEDLTDMVLQMYRDMRQLQILLSHISGLG